jgi:hypothetical protein
MVRIAFPGSDMYTFQMWVIAFFLAVGVPMGLSRYCVPEIRRWFALWQEDRREGRDARISLLTFLWYCAWYIVPPLLPVLILLSWHASWVGCEIVAALTAVVLAVMYAVGGL